MRKEEAEKYAKSVFESAKKFMTLEQEDILDKIRTDIEEYKSRQLGWAIGTEDLETGKQIALKYVLALIDEYKTESEG